MILEKLPALRLLVMNTKMIVEELAARDTGLSFVERGLTADVLLQQEQLMQANKRKAAVAALLANNQT